MRYKEQKKLSSRKLRREKIKIQQYTQQYENRELEIENAVSLIPIN